MNSELCGLGELHNWLLGLNFMDHINKLWAFCCYAESVLTNLQPIGTQFKIFFGRPTKVLDSTNVCLSLCFFFFLIEINLYCISIFRIIKINFLSGEDSISISISIRKRKLQNNYTNINYLYYFLYITLYSTNYNLSYIDFFFIIQFKWDWDLSH